jgi:hypothetical protein
VSTYILLVVTTFHNKHKNSVIARGTDRFFRKYCVSQEQSSLWESSGLSQRKFCAQGGLSYRRFIYWRNLLNERKSSPSKPTLLKISTTRTSLKPYAIAEPDSGLEVILPTGIKLYIKVEADISKASELIHLLGVSR